MTAALVLRGVSKVYGSGRAQVRALSRVDLAVEPGELVAVMGPSGSGKSTLLAIAGTLEQPTAGEVFIGDTDVVGLSANERAGLRRRWVGYVFQDFNLLSGLTVVENVALPLELDGRRARTARKAGLAALDDFELGDLADRFSDELSGGERQRVALARAMVGARTVMLADEPTGSLDSITSEMVMRRMRNACQAGVAGVVATHEARLAAWADRVVFLHDGRIADETAELPGPESLLVRAPGQ